VQLDPEILEQFDSHCEAKKEKLSKLLDSWDGSADERLQSLINELHMLAGDAAMLQLKGAKQVSDLVELLRRRSEFPDNAVKWVCTIASELLRLLRRTALGEDVGAELRSIADRVNNRPFID